MKKDELLVVKIEKTLRHKLEPMTGERSTTLSQIVRQSANEFIARQEAKVN